MPLRWKMQDVLCLDSSFYADCADYTDRFPRLADTLLNGTVLVVNGVDHRIMEIEVYLDTADHVDRYTHRDKDQGSPARWYFHRQSGGSYKGGTYKGLDITLGFATPRPDTFGGVLIRSIQSGTRGGLNGVDGVVETVGPCLVVDYLLRETKCTTITDLVAEIGTKTASLDVGVESKVYLRPAPALARLPVFRGPRVGLSYKYPELAVRDYRFLTNIGSVTKYKPSLAVNLLLTGKTCEEVAEITGSRQRDVERYQKLYDSGKELRGDPTRDLKPSNTSIVVLAGFMNR